jgi:hypothetical protein
VREATSPPPRWLWSRTLVREEAEFRSQFKEIRKEKTP